MACDFPEIKRVVAGDQTGICIDSHDPDQIAEAVNYLLENKKIYKELSENSRLASKKYNWDLEKNELLIIYNRANNVG